MIMPLEKIMSKTTYVAILTFGPVHEISNQVEPAKPQISLQSDDKCWKSHAVTHLQVDNNCVISQPGH